MSRLAKLVVLLCILGMLQMSVADGPEKKESEKMDSEKSDNEKKSDYENKSDYERDSDNKDSDKKESEKKDSEKSDYEKDSYKKGAEKMGIWIPMYFSPNSQYVDLVKSVDANKCLEDSFHGTVLSGPNSGPPNPKDAAQDKFYRNSFSVISKTKQWTGFGYITTRYMARPLAQVLADIDVWLSPGASGYGDNVQGIWVDNTVSAISAPAARAYYSAVIDRIQSYGKLVALNPGTNIRDCAFLESKKVAFVNNFEDYYSVWTQQPKDLSFDCPCKASTRCIASIHQYPKTAKTSDLAQTMSTMSARGYKAMFITERTMPNHYAALPSFWPSVLDAACQTNVNQANTNGASQTTTNGTTIAGQPQAAPSRNPATAVGHRRLLQAQ